MSGSAGLRTSDMRKSYARLGGFWGPKRTGPYNDTENKGRMRAQPPRKRKSG